MKKGLPIFVISLFVLLCVSSLFYFPDAVDNPGHTRHKVYEGDYTLSLLDKSASSARDEIIILLNKTIGVLENLSWDPVYGGYYLEFNSSGPVDDRKILFTLGSSIGSYALMYNLTNNGTYLQLAYRDMDWIDSFIHNGYYYLYFYRNFSSPSIPHLGYSATGYNTLGGLLNVILGLSYLYNITGNVTVLNRMESMWSYVYNNFWDNNYGGLHGLSDVGDYVKGSGTLGLYVYLSYILYKITNNSTYFNTINDCIVALEKMWYSGFLHSYNDDFSIYNSYRFGPINVFLYPLLAYATAYAITGNESYLDRIDTLINYMLTYDYDDTYGGLYFRLDTDYTLLDDRKQIYSHGALLISHVLLTRVFDINISENMYNLVIEVKDILMDKISKSVYLPTYYTSDWSMVYSEGRSKESFVAMLGLAYLCSMYDVSPPIIEEIGHEVLEYRIKIYAKITDRSPIENVTLSCLYNITDTWYRTVMSINNSGFYIAYIPTPLANATISVNITAIDVYKNVRVASYAFGFELYLENVTTLTTTTTVEQEVTTTYIYNITTTVFSAINRTVNQTITSIYSFATTIIRENVLTTVMIPMVVLVAIIVAAIFATKRKPQYESIS